MHTDLINGVSVTYTASTFVGNVDGVLVTHIASPTPSVYTEVVNGVSVTFTGSVFTGTVKGVLVAHTAASSPSVHADVINGVPVTYTGSIFTGTINGLKVTKTAPGLHTDMINGVTVTYTGSTFVGTVNGVLVTHTATPTMFKTQIAPSAKGTSSFTTNLGILELPEAFTNNDYFIAMYMPTLLSVLLKCFWTVIFAATMMMEPFFKLAEDGGAKAKESLGATFMSSSTTRESVESMPGHYIMMLTAGIYLMIHALAPLASESMGVQATGHCQTEHGIAPCNPAWLVNLTVIHLLQALLGAIAVAVAAVMFLQRKRTESGVYSNPSSIASIASLFHNKDVIRNFRQVDAHANKEELRASAVFSQVHI